MARFRVGLAAAVATTMLVAGSAFAQEFDAELFRASSPGDATMLSVHTAHVLRAQSLALGLRAGYSDDSVVAVDSSNDRKVAEVVGMRVTAELAAAYGFRRLELYGALPVIAFQDAEQPPPEAMLPVQGKSSGLGDLRIGARWRFYGDEENRLQLATSAEVSLPTSFNAELAGDQGLSLTPRFIAEVKGGPIVVAVNVGGRLRNKEVLGDLKVGTAFAYALGIAFDLPGKSAWSLIGELSGEVGGGSVEAAPVEVRGGVRWFSASGRYAIAGGYGRGVTRGYGAPEHRGVLVLDYYFGKLEPAEVRREPPRPKDPDPDRDNILGTADDCPNEAEDLDNYLDVDGCPELDNDEDKVPDTKDQCRDTAEDIDGNRDDDGCPDLDNDSDGITDDVDECPNEAEVINGVNDDDGCPDAGDQLVVIGEDRIIVNRKVDFRPGSAQMTAEAAQVIAQLAKLLERSPWLTRIRIEGHTDDVGDEAANRALSQKRANSVRDALIALGTASDRLEAVGYGEDKPIDSNTTPTGRAANRRVDFVILEKTAPNKMKPQDGQESGAGDGTK